MKIEINNEILEKFPNVKLGILIAKGIDNTKNHENLLIDMRNIEKKIKENLDLETLTNHPKINDWRNAYTLFGAKPKTYKNSVEALIRRVIKGSELPNINSLVNIYNMISIKHILPCGGDDLDKVDKYIELTFAKGDENFTILGSTEKETVDSGEVIYKDNTEVLCRKWNWRECDKTKMTENIKNVCLVIEGLDNTSMSEIQNALNELQENVEKYCGGEFKQFILSKEKNIIKF